MRDEARVILNSFLTYTSRGVAAIISLLLVSFMLTRLGEETYGVIGIANSFLSLVVLFELGIRPATATQFTRFFYGEERQRSNELISAAMVVCALMGIVIVVVVSLAGDTVLAMTQVPLGLRREAWLLLFVVSLALAVNLSGVGYGAVLVSHLRHDIQQYTEVLGVMLRAGLVVAMFSLWEPRLIVWGLAVLTAALVSVLILRHQSHRQVSSFQIQRRFVTKRGFRDLANLGVYTSLLRLADWANMMSGPLIIGYFLGPSLVAHYTPANAVMLQLQLLSGAFLAQMTPVITRAHATSDLARIRRILLRSTRYTLLITAGMMLLLASVSDEFVFTWLGPGFEDTALVLLLWCISGFLRAFMGAAFPVFLGTGRIRGIASFEVALAVFTISLSAFLVGWTPLGVIGAVLALLAGQVIRTTVYNFRACRILGIGAAEYARESFIGPSLCLGALAVTSMTLRNLIEAEPLVRLFGIGAIGFLVYSGLSWVVGLNAQDRLKVRGYADSGWRRLRFAAGRRELEGQNPDQKR